MYIQVSSTQTFGYVIMGNKHVSFISPLSKDVGPKLAETFDIWFTLGTQKQLVEYCII